MNIRQCIALLLVLPLMACQQTMVLYSDLTEREANEMLSLLFCSGLPAEKSLSGKKTAKTASYAVTTSESYFQNAVMLLQENDLPHERFPTMGNIFENPGPVSTALEQTARLNAAMSAELSSTLSGIDGVTSARVHLAMPKKSSLARQAVASSAAVAIRHRDDVGLEKELTKIKALIVDSVENLPYENVTVVFFPEKDLDCPSGKSTIQANLATKQQAATQPMLMQAIDARAWAVIAVLLFLSAVGSYLYSQKIPQIVFKKATAIREEKPK